ncbi:uncharacterized protein LOC119666446 [Teleopsis dalmanni]|uniref:uncharacterized protein LOC119666446 n=1 Tax=Teleopsis dalmanni TaxID=139649 RepID=UPI0018CD7F36|nr:uncharacterized protein LOC119666446 [Teleopsis dalmanni]
MEKIEYRSVKKFLHFKVKVELVYSKLAPWLTTIKYWKAEFERDLTSVFDEEGPRRPKEIATEKDTEKVHDILLDDPKLNCVTNISYECISNNLYKYLDMKKLSPRWIPRLVTIA